MIAAEILDVLDRSNDGYYCSFVNLSHPYSYLIDARLNIFRANDNRWAIAFERLGYSPRAGLIELEIFYYGNCLINLEQYNNRSTNSYSIYPIDQNNFDDTTDEERLKPNARFWLVRGQRLALSLDKQDYTDAGIELNELEPGEIRIEEAARLLVSRNGEPFRASDTELYKSIPTDLKKVQVLDEWFHKDFHLQEPPDLAGEDLRGAYELNKNLPGFPEITFEYFVQSFMLRQGSIADQNRKAWEDSRPSSYETWQKIAKVIATGDTSEYRPTSNANTHWSNWPESGAL